MAKNLACLQKQLESLFYIYGKFVARHPLPFIIIPFLITCVSAIGLIYLPTIMVDDPEYLYTPTNGPAKRERDIFQKTFTENSSHMFLPTRKTSLDGFINIIITAKSGGNILTQKYMDKIFNFDYEVKHNSFNGSSYLDVCAGWKHSCFTNVIFTVLNKSAGNIEQTTLSYPTHDGVYFLASQIGGVSLKADDVIASAKAIRLSYFVKYETTADMIESDKWITGIKDYLLNFQDNDIQINFQTFLSNEEELGKSLEGILPRFALTYVILLSFCVFSCAMTDWVRTKIWVAMAGQLAAGMAVLTSLGVLCAAGVPFATSVGVMPFLILGIGIDDMFVILSSWRHTSYTLPVEERMGQTLKTAAISITVTSVTDALAFGVGSLSVFRIVTLFCVYTGVAVIFSYIYALTFLAACVAISGQREAVNSHALTCRRVLPKSQAGNKSKLYQLFCTGGHSKDYEKSKESKDQFEFPLLTELLRRYFATLMMTKPAKIITIIFFFIYIGFAIWGCFVLEKGLKLQLIAPSSSYLRHFYDENDENFSGDYGYRIMIAFTDTLDYSDKSVQLEVNKQLDIFRNSSYYYSDEAYTESWLSSYINYLNITDENPSNMTEFIHILRTKFFKHPPYDMFQLDTAFSKDYTEIVASRFVLQSVGFNDTTYVEPLMTASRDIIKRSQFNMAVYHPEFIFYDPYTVIMGNTLQNLGIAVVSMLVVSVLLLPSFLSAVFVTLSVISMCTGVIGFMAFWGVNLDTVSMINLIMCIGFSVDFSAHISYHVSISEASTGDKRVKDAIGHIGTPVLQGAVSTILGVLVLATSESYLFLCFFKVMFLVMVIGVLHALFFLPVVLSFLPSKRCCGCSICCGSDTYELKQLEAQNRLAFANGHIEHIEHESKCNGVNESKSNGVNESKCNGVNESKCNGVNESKCNGVNESKCNGVTESKCNGVT